MMSLYHITCTNAICWLCYTCSSDICSLLFWDFCSYICGDVLIKISTSPHKISDICYLFIQKVKLCPQEMSRVIWIHKNCYETAELRLITKLPNSLIVQRWSCWCLFHQFEFWLSRFSMLLCKSSEGLLKMKNSHLFFSTPCLFICLRKDHGSEQAKSHWLHLFDFSSLCVFKCVLKWLAQKDAKSHWLHLFFLSPLCVFICDLKWSAREDA